MCKFTCGVFLLKLQICVNRNVLLCREATLARSLDVVRVVGCGQCGTKDGTRPEGKAVDCG